jgi:hypothetical protein
MRSARAVAVGVLALSVLALVGCSLFQNRPPVAVFVARPVEGHPAWVTLDASGSTDPENDLIVSYSWIFGADEPGVNIITPLGFLTKTVPVATIVVDYVTVDAYEVTLVVTDEKGKVSDPAVQTITLPLPPAD